MNNGAKTLSKSSKRLQSTAQQASATVENNSNCSTRVRLFHQIDLTPRCALSLTDMSWLPIWIQAEFIVSISKSVLVNQDKSPGPKTMFVVTCCKAGPIIKPLCNRGLPMTMKKVLDNCIDAT